MYVHAYMHAYVFGGQGQHWLSFLRHGSSWFVRHGLSLAGNLPNSLGWMASEPQGTVCLCLLRTGITNSHHYTQFLFFYLNLGPGI